MSSGTFIFLALIAMVLVWVVVTYNQFVGSRNRFQNAFAQIDVQLKRRYDLIPNLVSATRSYLKHEQQTLESVVTARAAAMQAGDQARKNPLDGNNLAGLSSAEGALNMSLGRLLALSESYPELKADGAIASLSEELSSTESRITFARQAFNDQVTTYNTGVESFPNSVVAKISGFERAAQLQATRSEAEREPVVVAL